MWVCSSWGLSGQSEGSTFCTRQQEMKFHDTLAVPEAYVDFFINSSQSDSDNGLILTDR